MLIALWRKMLDELMLTKETSQGRRRLAPIEFALRAAFLVTVVANVIAAGGLILLEPFGLVTDFVNGLALALTLSTVTAFPLTMLICWLNARQVQRLEQSHERFLNLSRTDALTGLNNRLGLYAACVNLGTKYCVAFLDIDHFKTVNDKFGHLAGDMMIVSVADTIRSSFDASALVARLGGEEFVVVQETDRQFFLNRCETVRAGVEASYVDFQGVPIRTTISIGVAFREDWEIFEKVLHDADLALYRAKADGRNRVCSRGLRDSHLSVVNG